MNVKFSLFLFACLITIITLNVTAQICNDIPIVLEDNHFEFSASDIESFGDSMIVFNLTNNHATEFFAYPQAKFVMLSPLPSGMSIGSINVDWAVFASAWIIGETLPVRIYYDVNAAIELDYTITFRLWLNNLIPVIDSCFFDTIYSLNLNPSGTEINAQLILEQYQVYPNPVQTNEKLFVTIPFKQTDCQYFISNILGNVIQSGKYEQTGIALRHLSAGLYTFHLTNQQQIKGIVTFVVQ